MGGMMGGWKRLSAWAACALMMASPGLAQEKTGVKSGFILPPGSARIVLMRPSVIVGAQSTGGMFEPNADWTDEARRNIDRAIQDIQGQLGNSVAAYDSEAEEAGALSGEYRSLFTSVADSVREYQFFPGNRLPTKKRDKGFDWSIGTDVADLPGLSNADYVLFISTEDHYGSTGRKMLQIFAAMGGVSVPTGLHKGYAGLVDVKTGELVWLNADLQMGGDVRTADGAQKRVGQLFEGFPGRTMPLAQNALPGLAQP
ncbi:hypothetical protein [Sphingobium baderi]